MKSVKVTSKTSMNLPASFTMKQLQDANPGVKYPTLNARIDKMVKNGEVLEVTSVKTGTGRGRAALVYALPDASTTSKDKSNPIYQAKKQGRYVPVASVKAPETVTVPVEVVPTPTDHAVASVSTD